jgi:hypothetical protein
MHFSYTYLNVTRFGVGVLFSSFSRCLGWTNISGVEVEQRGVLRHDIPAERAEALLRKMKDSRLEIQPCAHILDCVSFCIGTSPYRCDLLSAVRPHPIFRRTDSHLVTSGQKVKSKDARIEQ